MMIIYVFSMIHVEPGVYNQHDDTGKSFMVKYLRKKYFIKIVIYVIYTSIFEQYEETYHYF